MRAGTTGGRVGQRRRSAAWCRGAVALPSPPPLAGPGRAGPAVVADVAASSADLAGADLGGQDAELLLGVGVQEARGEPAHDVVGHRLRERDLRVRGDPFRLEAHVGELPHERLERHAVLQRDRDRRRERVHHAAEGRALLADVGEEDLADRAVLVHAGGDVALVAAERELVRERLALARHPAALRPASARVCLTASATASSTIARRPAASARRASLAGVRAGLGLAPSTSLPSARRCAAPARSSSRRGRSPAP